MSLDPKHIAIVGAGLAGCALALALAGHDLSITIYEAKAADADSFLSGILISPNGLQVLEGLGVLPRITDESFKITQRCVKNDKDENLSKAEITSDDNYGYLDHRIWRKLLADTMKTMLEERGVHTVYNAKFEGVQGESVEGVQYWINGTLHSSSLLIGADGVYSTVRKYLDKDVEPAYTGTLGIAGHTKYSSISWPHENYEHNFLLQGKPGALFVIPESADGEDIMVGIQVVHPEQSREDLAHLQNDKDRLLGFFQSGYHEWGSTARKLIDKLAESRETLFTWPYVKLPNLSRWYSSSGRVVIMGDASHALPPSSGQGVNQALEDASSLATVLTFRDGAGRLLYDSNVDRYTTVLGKWQAMRQQRIDHIFDWVNNVMNVQRLPEAERRKLIAEGKVKECKPEGRDYTEWLYQPKTEIEIQQALGLA